MEDKIVFHIDVNNAFLSWSAVYLLQHGYQKDIRKIPAIIGGDEAKRRGIVLAKSPIAKKYGIVTAETLYSARRKCPSLQIFSPNYEWYYQKSRELMNYLSQYTPTMEQFSIDECFLDMSGTRYLYSNYLELAYFIKNDIKKRFGYTVNIGIANNKLCAKMASDFEKPDRVHTLMKEEVKEKMWPLSVGRLFMVGKRTAELLEKIGIHTIGELAMADDEFLQKHFKNQGKALKEMANGIDYHEVVQKMPKNESISISETLPYDYYDEKKIEEILFRQTTEVSRELRAKKKYAKTVAVVFKNSEFVSYSAQETLVNATDQTEKIYEMVVMIFRKHWKKDPIRLIGIRLSSLTETRKQQLSLFDEVSSQEDSCDIQKTLDEINKKYGSLKVGPASLALFGKSKYKNQYKNED